MKIKMKLTVLVASVLALFATSANAKSIKSIKKNTVPAAARSTPPLDRYFDAAHGPNDPCSLWMAGDYVGRDPDLGVRAAMMRTPYN